MPVRHKIPDKRQSSIFQHYNHCVNRLTTEMQTKEFGNDSQLRIGTGQPRYQLLPIHMNNHYNTTKQHWLSQQLLFCYKDYSYFAACCVLCLCALCAIKQTRFSTPCPTVTPYVPAQSDQYRSILSAGAWLTLFTRTQVNISKMLFISGHNLRIWRILKFTVQNIRQDNYFLRN
jgi:hypothetical protein